MQMTANLRIRRNVLIERIECELQISKSQSFHQTQSRDQDLLV